jgi:hypothetical protein
MWQDERTPWDLMHTRGGHVFFFESVNKVTVIRKHNSYGG